MLQEAFYVVAIIFMAVTTLFEIGIIIGVILLLKKMEQMQKEFKEQVDNFTDVTTKPAKALLRIGELVATTVKGARSVFR